MSTFKSLLACWVILVISRRCDVTNAAAGSRENPPAARQHAQHELTGGRRVYCRKALECLHHTHYPLAVGSDSAGHAVATAKAGHFNRRQRSHDLAPKMYISTSTRL